MRRLLAAVLVLVLATAVHVDWHLARPAAHHRRLGLGWDQHWIVAALVFVGVGWVVGRVWRDGPWKPGGWIAAVAVAIAQGIEPVAESVLYLHRLSYPAEPERWTAFLVCMSAALPAYALGIALSHRARVRSAARF